jgi:hypothetical protein
MSNKISYNKKIEKMSEDLTLIHNKFKQIDFKDMDTESLENFKRVVKVLDYYTLTVIEISSKEGVQLAKDNPDMIKELIKNIENFITEVNDSIIEE